MSQQPPNPQQPQIQPGIPLPPQSSPPIQWHQLPVLGATPIPTKTPLGQQSLAMIGGKPILLDTACQIFGTLVNAEYGVSGKDRLDEVWKDEEKPTYEQLSVRAVDIAHTMLDRIKDIHTREMSPQPPQSQAPPGNSNGPHSPSTQNETNPDAPRIIEP